jgi:hypothetical protein
LGSKATIIISPPFQLPGLGLSAGVPVAAARWKARLVKPAWVAVAAACWEARLVEPAGIAVAAARWKTGPVDVCVKAVCEHVYLLFSMISRVIVAMLPCYGHYRGGEAPKQASKTAQNVLFRLTNYECFCLFGKFLRKIYS